MLFKIEWLDNIFPEKKGVLDKHTSINGVTIDSRDKAENSLFIPIKGDRFDGHDYIDSAIESGAVAVLWDKNNSLPINNIDKINIYLVEDTLMALQKLSQAYRDLINPKVIGVTGSNGKTTTKDILASVLSMKFKTHATKGNFNNHIGLPLTILSSPRDTEVLILEMGMSGPGEIDELVRIAKPDYAVITNIGESHIEHLGSRKGIANAKLEIMNNNNQNRVLIYDGDEDLLKGLSANNTYSCGFDSGNTYRLSDVNISTQVTRFKLNDNTYEVPLLGDHHAKNAGFSIIIAEKLGMLHEEIRQGLMQLEYTGMRFEMYDGQRGVTIINDAYNASPTSMKAAINVVDKLSLDKKKVLILGDILEMGAEYEAYYLEIASVLENTNIKYVYTYGEHSQIITDYLLDNTQIKAIHYTSRIDLTNELKSLLSHDILLFFKASRGLYLEKIISVLE